MSYNPSQQLCVQMKGSRRSLQTGDVWLQRQRPPVIHLRTCRLDRDVFIFVENVDDEFVSATQLSDKNSWHTLACKYLKKNYSRYNVSALHLPD